MQALTEVCPSCNGTGLLVKKSHILYDIEEWLKRYSLEGKGRSVILQCHPDLVAELNEGFFSKLFKLKLKYRLFIKLVSDETLAHEKFKFLSKSTGDDLSDEFVK
jgi:ribonuclease G